MSEFRRIVRQFWFYILLSHLAIGGFGFMAWELLLRFSPYDTTTILVLSTLAAYSGLLLILLIFYLVFLRPLKRIYHQLEQITQGKLKQQNQKKLGIFAGLGEGLNAVTNKLQEFLTRAQAETEVIAAETNRLRSVLNAIADGVLALDKSQNIILFNKAASKITAQPIAEVAGRSINDIFPLSQEGGRELQGWLKKHATSDLAREHWDRVELTTKDGKNRILELDVLHTSTDPNGIYTLITFHDKTEAMEVEDMKVDFVSLAAHELRTPVTVIKGYLDILDEELKPSMDAKHQEFLRKIEISANQLSGMINNILRVSRIEHGDLNLKIEEVDWGEFLQEGVSELQEQAEAKGRQLQISLPENLPAVAADRVSVQEVINNLIGNAIKYTERGEGKIEVKAEAKDNLIETTVSDNGAGIPANLIDKLFVKFYRSHRTREAHKGTGLGLYMSKAIVEAHGGSIWVNSKEGEGTTFGFTLPLYSEVAGSDQSDDNNTKITKGVHGWIKNHSLYRR